MGSKAFTDRANAESYARRTGGTVLPVLNKVSIYGFVLTAVEVGVTDAGDGADAPTRGVTGWAGSMVLPTAAPPRPPTTSPIKPPMIAPPGQKIPEAAQPIPAPTAAPPSPPPAPPATVFFDCAELTPA